MAEFLHPEQLISADELEARLGEPNLRIFECTTYLAYEEGTGRPYSVVSGRADYEAGHVPGAGFLDLQADFSEAGSPYSFCLPTPEAAAAAFGRHGLGDGCKAVLYARGSLQWATRFWWMLRWLGFDDAAVLDGGFETWTAEGRPVSTGPSAYPPATLSIAPRPELFVGRDEVLAAIDEDRTCTINALSGELHRGENARYGRPGRVPSSVNVPAASLYEAASLRILDADAVAQAFADVGATRDKKIIAYCGGGIAATLDAFLLHQLGHRDVAVYDASMSEWAKDETLPIETG